MLGKSLLAVLATAGLVGSATAADLYIPEVVIEPELFSWTSCYVGAKVTYTRGTTTSFFPYSDYNTDPTGPGLAPQVGCDWQMPDSPIVLGVVVDAAIEGIEASSDVVAGPPLQTLTTTLPWSASVRVRAGVAADKILFYATGGLAVAEVENNLVIGGFDETASNTQFGWTAGLGVEAMVTDDISIFAEYRYTDLGEADFTFPGADFDGGGLDTLPFGTTTHTIQAGINFRF